MQRILAQDLISWTRAVLAQLGLPVADAAHIARCLVEVDLRGIVSHGTRQLRRYVPEFRDGLINPRPQIDVLHQADSTIRLDGDGGAGYLVATRAADAAVQKAQTHGIGLAASCNHGHVGSAGIYARRASEQGLVSWGVAGGSQWSKPDSPAATVWDAMRAPPMCFGIPAAAGPPLVVDLNANFFTKGAGAEEALAQFPKTVFASLGLRFVSTLLGGVLAGSCLPAESEPVWLGATRGFMFVAIAPDAIGDAASFSAEVQRISAESRTLAPLAGTDRAELPGSREWQRQRDWAQEGIPLAVEHVELLRGIEKDLGLPLPELI